MTIDYTEYDDEYEDDRQIIIQAHGYTVETLSPYVGVTPIFNRLPYSIGQFATVRHNHVYLKTDRVMLVRSIQCIGPAAIMKIEHQDYYGLCQGPVKRARLARTVRVGERITVEIVRL